MKNAKISVSDENVTLEIDDVENCLFELWTVDDVTKSCVKIKIPDEVWAELVRKWKEQRGEK